MTTVAAPRVVDTVIVGSGPAGYAAAVYTARANLAPVVVEGSQWGGLLQQTTDVENYPGFRDGIMGPELMDNMRGQAERFGAEMITAQVTELRLASSPSTLHRVRIEDGTELAARTVIMATGADHKKLGVPGEAELSGRGVSYCATCDAAFFRKAQTVVIGGGDSAMEEALFLARFAASVTVVNRRSQFRASPIMLERARQTPNIAFAAPYVVERLVAADNGTLTSVLLRHADNGAELSVPAEGAFIAVGHEPQSSLVQGQLTLDKAGYIVTESGSTRTRLPGVFAAGDVVDHTYRQAITAAASGCQAALDAGWYLRDTPGVRHPAALPPGNLAEAQWTPAMGPAAFAAAGGAA